MNSQNLSIAFLCRWVVYKTSSKWDRESRDSQPEILKEIELSWLSLSTHKWYTRYVTAKLQLQYPKQDVEYLQIRLEESKQPEHYHQTKTISAKSNWTKALNRMNNFIEEIGHKRLFSDYWNDPVWPRIIDKFERKAVEYFTVKYKLTGWEKNSWL